MKIFLAQQNYHIGNFDENTKKIVSAIRQAIAENGDLIVFSELAICGYPPRDFLEFDDFIEACNHALELIKQETQHIGVLIGAPSKNSTHQGKPLFNSAYLLYENEIKGMVHKSLLPNYDIFDEYRYFEPAFEWNIIEFKGKKLAVTICEDLWNLGNNSLYRFCPMDKLMVHQPDIMINLSASPFDYIHAEDRKKIIKNNITKYGLPLIYCNTVGSQTELVFDGGSMIVNAEGELVKELAYFKEDLQSVNWLDNNSFITNETDSHKVLSITNIHSHSNLQANFGIENIYAALISGISDYFKKMGFSKAIVASSGGIDSALVLALACRALGPENVSAVLMPSQFSTNHSVDDAIKLSENLGNHYDIISIRDIFECYENTLKPLFNNLPFNVAEENLQSRIRGTLVMAFSNKFGSILLNTSNKSELATGYGTLYGDMAGGLGVLGDLYKVQVYALAKYINREVEIIPQNILEKAPSAELRPGQKDADSLPDYTVLDAVLYKYIELRMGPKEIIATGVEANLVHRVLKMVNNNEYKRNQFCPIIRVSPKAFGIGRRVPIVGKYLS